MWCSPVGTLALSQSLSPEHLYRACRGLNLAFTASPTKNIGCKGVCYAGSLQLVRLWVGSESGLEGTALTLPHAPPPSLLALIPAFFGGGGVTWLLCATTFHTHMHTLISPSLPPRLSHCVPAVAPPLSPPVQSLMLVFRTQGGRAPPWPPRPPYLPWSVHLAYQEVAQLGWWQLRAAGGEERERELHWAKGQGRTSHFSTSLGALQVKDVRKSPPCRAGMHFGLVS